MEADLRDALIAWQDGELPSERAEELLARLQTDAEFRRAFATEVWTLSLTRVAQAPDPRWLALQEELGLSATVQDAVSDGAFEDAVMETVRSEPVRFVDAWWRWAAYAGIAACVALAVAWTLWSSRPTPKGGTQTLAVLVQSPDAVWKGKPPGPSGTLGAERIQLEAGHASLLFTSGARLDFDGRADLELVSADRVVCREGRLRTNVPGSAAGFCVETPRGAVTDLGTELSILVAADGKTNVTVLEGQAEVALKIPGQEGVRTALLNREDTAELLPGTGEIRMGAQPASLEASRLRLPELALSPKYGETILAAKPRDYWRLDRMRDGAVPNEMAGPDLRLAGAASLERDEFGRTSALLHGKKQPGVFYLDEAWPKPARSYAIEMWFATDSMDQMALVALTAPEVPSKHLALVETGSRRPGRNTEAGILRYLVRWPANSRGGMNIYSQSVALPYRWHHFVAQQNEGDLQLFIDGESVGTARADTFPGSIPCSVQFGCLAYRPGADLGRLQRVFSGRLAEIAIYERLLSTAEVRQHAGLGK